MQKKAIVLLQQDKWSAANLQQIMHLVNFDIAGKPEF